MKIHTPQSPENCPESISWTNISVSINKCLFAKIIVCPL